METKFFWGSQKAKYVILCCWFFFFKLWLGSSRLKGFNKLNFEEDLWIEYVNLYKFFSIFVPKKKNIPILLTGY